MANKNAEKDKFSQMIEERALRDNISHIEAIVEYCAKMNLEIEIVKGLVNKSLKDKVEDEARSLNMIVGGRGSRLPL